MATSIDDNDGESTKTTKSQLIRNSITTTTTANVLVTTGDGNGANTVASTTAVAPVGGTAEEGGDSNNKITNDDEPQTTPGNDYDKVAANNDGGGDDGATTPMDAAATAAAAVKTTEEPSSATPPTAVLPEEEKWLWRRWGKLFLQSFGSCLVRLPSLIMSILSLITTAIPWSKLSSVPIVKILQVVWLVLMIGQSLPAASQSFWPFNKHGDANNATMMNMAKSVPLSPFHVEMRSDMYGHEKQFAKQRASSPLSESSIVGQGLLMTLLFGSGNSNNVVDTAGDDNDYQYPVNTGIPKQQYITLTHMNRALDGYLYSMKAAVTTKVQAGRVYGQTSFRRVLEQVLARIVPSRQDREAVTLLEERFLARANLLTDRLRHLRAESLSSSSLLVAVDDAATTTTKTASSSSTTTHHHANSTSLLGRRNLPQCNNTKHRAVAPPAVVQPPPFLQSWYSSTSTRRDELIMTTTLLPRADVCANNNNNNRTRTPASDKSTNNNQTDFVPLNASSTTTTAADRTGLTLNSNGTNETTNGTTTTNTTTTTSTVPEQIKQVNSELSALVTTFLNQIVETVTPGPANMLKDALLGHAAIWGPEALAADLQVTPLRTLFRDAQRRRRLYVTYFNGDIMATTVAVLREEVTAMVRGATPGVDEVLVVLQSGGGTVTGYGLVAAQLLRLKRAGLTLTVAVEQVAASGGYMAACVGDTIVCSPFAVVGSIGVIQEMPNVYERLKREGVEFHQVTAGQYKRVLSPTKAVTPEDLQKSKDDIEEVWTLFKDFVSEQRPTLDMETVATGEVWYGKRAVEVGLCDAVQAADDVLIEFIDRGYDVYRVKYEEPIPDFWEQLTGKATASHTESGAGSSLLRWCLQKMLALLQAELGNMAGIGIDNHHQHRPLLV